MSKTLTTNEFIEKYSFLNKPVKIIGKYENCKTKIECECLICKSKFMITPDCLMQGQIHKECATKIATKSRTSNTNKFKQKLKNINADLSVVGEYIDAKTQIDINCLKCGYNFKSTPNRLLSGCGCPSCSKHIVRTTDDLYNQISNNPKIDIDILSEITSSNKKINVKCKVCNHKWTATPITLIRCGCPNCDKLKRTKSHNVFVEEIKNINPDIKIISEYKGQKVKVKCECLKDGYQWYAMPDNLLKGTGCPACRNSKGERKCRMFLDKYKIEYIQQMVYDGLVGVNNGLLRYDFYLPTYNLLIEYQGEFHDGKVSRDYQSLENFKIQQEHDKRKREYAKQNNIKLLEIWYWDYNNIEEILLKELDLSTNSFFV